MSVPQPRLFPTEGDDAAREAIRARLGETLFVEAGAGSGKTAALVDRIVALVRDEQVPIRAIAAITFTDKAAAELRHRVRAELERHAPGEPACRAALDDLDAAAICTLHAFAQRLLTDFPIEAGLPPRVQVTDEIASAVAFDERWREFHDRLLDDPANEETVLYALACGVKLDRLRNLAEVLSANWDLLDRVPPAPPLPEVGPAVEGWLAALEAVCERGAECRDGEDRLLGHLQQCAERVRSLREAPDDVERLTLLAGGPKLRTRFGRRDNWPDVEAVRAELAALDEARERLCEQVASAVIRRFAAAIARFTADAAAERRAAGELEFHDLLVLARAMLRDRRHGPRVRERLRARYRRLLVDEFQDTDPIQVELAVLLGSGDPDAGEKPWTAVDVEPGRVFFVGDPKQSIYRFRRADIATFLAARDTLTDAPLRLTRNFRTVEPVVAWINHVFDELIRPYPGSQPEYVALEPVREAPPSGPPVALLGVDEHDDEPDADTLREREAADVVAAVRTAIADGWSVGDGDGGWRPARLGDVCVLLPARTSLGFLERALDDAGIPYRAETSSLVYGSREVRDLLVTLRAADDPTDALALVSALRSPLFGCGDDDLFEFRREHGGRFDIRRRVPETLPADHPVVEGIAYVRDLHDARMWTAPSVLLERLVRDRNVLEVGHSIGRFREVSRRIRFVVDQARAFADTTGGTLREYLAWATRQGAEGSRVVETVLPETDDDAVRILTVHGAKGLEFPIVVCSGMTTRAQQRARGVQVLFPPDGGCEIRLASGVQTDQFELHQPVDEQMGFHEKLRLLYVACTRARDHLVVSVHRKARRNGLPDEPSGWTHAELLWRASRGAIADSLAAAGAPVGVVPARTAVERPPADWQRQHATAMAHGARRRFVAATTLAHREDEHAPPDPGLAKQPRDLELPPWNKGRYGTAIGRAVHAVLQTVDLAGGEGLDAAAAAQAAAEGVLGHETTIAALVRAALASSSIRDAVRSGAYWRETYVGVPVEGLTLEGYVDLVYRDPSTGALVVVDYKTDSIGGDELERRLEHYRVQGAAYALAVGAATGEQVQRCTFVFCDPGGAREVTIDGDRLGDAMARVRALVAAERDDPSPIGAPVPAEP